MSPFLPGGTTCLALKNRKVPFMSPSFQVVTKHLCMFLVPLFSISLVTTINYSCPVAKRVFLLDLLWFLPWAVIWLV